MNRIKFLFLLASVSCATQLPEKPQRPVTTLPPIEVENKVQFSKIPNYVLPASVPKQYPESVKLIKEFGNSDVFFSYVLKKRTYYAHTTLSPVEVVQTVRKCLERGEEVRFQFYNHWWSDAIGSWNGTVMRQNIGYKPALNTIERAGHIYHETMHKCGFRHQGNYATKYDNRASVPYAMGYDFEDFITEKLTPALAGE